MAVVIAHDEPASTHPP